MQARAESRSTRDTPVRTVIAAKGEAPEIVMLTGHIRAEDEPALAFRIGGK